MTTRTTLLGVAFGALMVATTWAYAPALRGGLQFDDKLAITQNLAIKDLGGFVRSHFLRELGGDGRPVTNLSFALNYAATGLGVLPLHLTNLAIHLVAVLLAFAFARELFRRAGTANPGALGLAAAAIFALHPLQTEAVSYLCQRAESLASALYLAALLSLLSSEQSPRRWRGAVLYFAALLLFALAMGTKPIASTVPLAFLLTALCFERTGAVSRSRALRLLGLAGPFLLLAAASAFTHVRKFRGRADVGFDMARVTTRQYLLTEPRALLAYLRLAFWPAGLSIDHDFALSQGPDAATVAAMLAVAALAIGATWLVVAGARAASSPGARASRLVGFGLLWFFVVLLPTSSVIPLADVMVEHRLYLPLLGLAIGVVGAAGCALERLPASSRRWLGPAAALGVCLSLTLALEQRNHAWSSQLSLWRDATDKAPAKARPRANYAQALFLALRYEEAVAEYRRALASPADGSIVPYQMQANISTALMSSGKYAEAAQELESSLSLRPDDPHLLNDLAVCLLEQGQQELAASYAQRALAVRPNFGPALNTLGQVLMDRGDYAAALPQLLAAVRQDPDFAPPLYNLARAFASLGRMDEACAALARYRRAPDAFVDDALEHEKALGCSRAVGAAAP